jgi:hypothetical protein
VDLQHLFHEPGSVELELLAGGSDFRLADGILMMMSG